MLNKGEERTFPPQGRPNFTKAERITRLLLLSTAAWPARVILIYEADFNLLLAVKWRQLLHHADTKGLLNPGQFGGRPGCKAQSLAFLEELKYDIVYLSRRTLLELLRSHHLLGAGNSDQPEIWTTSTSRGRVRQHP
jgi:hypothetical protein